MLCILISASFSLSNPQGFCPLRQLPRYSVHGNALDAFQIGDKVRAFILDVHVTGRLILSMNPKMLNRDLYGDLKLLQSFHTIHVTDIVLFSFRKLQNLDGKSYEAYLESTPQFRNPDGLRVLCARMGIPRSSACSLLYSVTRIRLCKPEMACELRRTQLLTFSMKHVAQGVKYFKEGRNNEALQCYNFAIEVEPTNPDAYVARGALYASVGTYTKAVDNLEKSLELQANHANAKNYLGQTLVAYAGEISRKDPIKAEQLLQRAVKLDPDNIEAQEALRELPSGGQDTSLRSWSRSPSPQTCSRAPGSRREKSPLSPVQSSRGSAVAGGGYSTHVERSRAALEQLVEEDRSKRAAKDANRNGPLVNQSPSVFYSPGRSLDRRRSDHSRDDIKSGPGLEKGTMERGDLSKIVITRNRSGRIIRCKDDGDVFNSDRGRRDGSWKRLHEDEMAQERDKRGRLDPDECRGTRRVFTPPRHAREGEHGSLTVYSNENDLPMTSKSLQERLQARIRAIERRHQLEENNTQGVDTANGSAVANANKSRESSCTVVAPDEYPINDSPSGIGSGGGYSGQLRGAVSGLVNFDRRSGAFHRPDYYGNRGGYFSRPRGRGPRWRGQWDDYRGRRGNWYNNRFDDRRREVQSGLSGERSFERRRKRHGVSGSPERSSRSRSPSHLSRSPRSRSISRSNRSSSASPSPIRSNNRRRVISRARISTPPLAPLTNAKRSDSDENLAELDQFVAQLRAKREMEHQLQQQQQLMTHAQETNAVYPGPQEYPNGSVTTNDAVQTSADALLSRPDMLHSPVQYADSMTSSGFGETHPTVKNNNDTDIDKSDLNASDEMINAVSPCPGSPVTLPSYKNDSESDARTTMTVSELTDDRLAEELDSGPK
ncbi:Tetratricopeptide repeat protein 14 [Fasciola hepatica]|uniref:Tetratricopeptide repeat protein 14 n=1 Tax=Fasciola hepatica TaxID=6192 RepID=A0A4E0R3G7_FASHE|nr:Tetratricopeptide repeat protein 14 [Fasciola hepatica]